jgi:hypothetical protein
LRAGYAEGESGEGRGRGRRRGHVFAPGRCQDGAGLPSSSSSSSSSSIPIKVCYIRPLVVSSADESHRDQDQHHSPSLSSLNIEMYQKKTQLEHILLCPDTYIGSTELIEQPMWVYEITTASLVFKPIQFVPGLYKIFDEILVNAADNKVGSSG